MPNFEITDNAVMMLGVFDEVVYLNKELLTNFVNLINTILVNLNLLKNSSHEEIRNETQKNLDAVKNFLCNSQVLGLIPVGDVLKNIDRDAWYGLSELYKEVSKFDEQFLNSFFDKKKFDVILKLMSMRNPYVTNNLLIMVSNLVNVPNLEAFMFQKNFLDEVVSCLAFRG